MGGAHEVLAINGLDHQHDGTHLASCTGVALERVLEISSAAKQILHEIGASGPATRNDQDLETLRSIVFESRFMSDVDQVSGNRIVCTDVRNRLRAPWGLAAPDRIDTRDTHS